MAVPLVVNGVTYNYPVNEEESYGVNATNWAIAVTDVLDTVFVSGDLGPPTSPALAISTTAGTYPVTDLAFSPSVVRGFIVHYTIEVTTSTITNNEFAVGTLRGIYNSTTNSWILDNDYIGTTTYTFDISTPSTGQIEYTLPSSITGTILTNIMKYRAQVLPF